MWLFKKKREVKQYDKEKLEPVLRSSICTGETTAGFRNKHNGDFLEVMLINGQADLDEFKEMYGIEGELKTIY